MKNSEVVELLNTIKGELNRKNLKWAFIDEKEERFEKDIRRIRVISGIAEQLSEYLAGLEKTKTHHLIRKISSSVAIDNDIVTYLLVRLAIEGDSKKAIKIIEEILDLKEAICHKFTMVSGINIDEDIVISKIHKNNSTKEPPEYSGTGIL